MLSSPKLKQIISQLENLEEQKGQIAEGIKEVFADARNEGFDIKILRQVLKIRKMKPEEVTEQEELLDMYLRALESTERACDTVK